MHLFRQAFRVSYLYEMVKYLSLIKEKKLVFQGKGRRKKSLINKVNAYSSRAFSFCFIFVYQCSYENYCYTSTSAKMIWLFFVAFLLFCTLALWLLHQPPRTSYVPLCLSFIGTDQAASHTPQRCLTPSRRKNFGACVSKLLIFKWFLLFVLFQFAWLGLK